MAEYIDRDRLLDSLWDDERAAEEDDPIDGIITIDYDRAARIIEAAPAADVAPAQKWTSIKDKLPENEGQVLAVYHFKSNASMQFIGTLCYFLFDPQPHWQHESTGLVVTHWMPLPEPPKEA